MIYGRNWRGPKLFGAFRCVRGVISTLFDSLVRGAVGEIECFYASLI